MKPLLRKIFSFVLTPLENSKGQYEYKPSHRTILRIVGFLFLGVASAALYFSLLINELSGLLPTILFTAISLVCLVVAGVGNDKAVAKIWRNRND